MALAAEQATGADETSICAAVLNIPAHAIGDESRSGHAGMMSLLLCLSLLCRVLERLWENLLQKNSNCSPILESVVNCIKCHILSNNIVYNP